MTTANVAVLLFLLQVVSAYAASSNTTSDSNKKDLKEEVAPRMMVDLTRETDDYLPENAMGLRGAIFIHDAPHVYGPPGAFFGGRPHHHRLLAVPPALVLPGAAPLSFGSAMPLFMGGLRPQPAARPSGKHKGKQTDGAVEGNSENLLVKLTMSSALRDNLVTVFGYLLYHTRWATHRDQYTAFFLLYQAVRLRHISTLDLLPVLKKASAEQPSSQMLLILRQTRKSCPRYLSGAIDEVISAVSTNKKVIDEIIQPRGGPLVVDFLAGIDSQYLTTGEMPISFGKRRLNPSVVSLMGRTFGQIYSALADSTLPLTQPLFAALLLHLPRGSLNPRADEFMRMLVDLLRLERIGNWSSVIRKIPSKDKQKPFALARFILKTIVKDSKMDDNVRDATLVVLHHLREPQITFSHHYYSVLSPIVSKPNIDLASLLQTISYPEYSDDIVDVKNRIVYYIKHGYLNLDLITKGFMRYDHVRPLDLIIALLTRITTKMPQLPAEIMKSVRSLTIHLRFKELGCSMASNLPENFIDLPSLTFAFLSPSLPLIIQETAEKALKVAFHGLPEDINKLLPSIPVETCIRPRMCLHKILTKAIEMNVLKTSGLVPEVKKFLRIAENLINMKHPSPTKTAESYSPATLAPNATNPVPIYTSQLTTVSKFDNSSSPQNMLSTHRTETPFASKLTTTPAAPAANKPISKPPAAGAREAAAIMLSNNRNRTSKPYTSSSSKTTPSVNGFTPTVSGIIAAPSVVSSVSPPIPQTELPKIEKGPDGRPIFPTDKNGKPTFHTTPQGQPVLITGSDGKPIFPTGPDGNPIYPTTPNGKPIFVKGQDGKIVIPFTSDGKPVYPKTSDGKPIVPTASDGNPIFPTTSGGAPVLPVNSDGQPIFPVGSDGMPIAPKGSDGKPTFTVGLDGRLILVIGKDHMPKVPLGLDGHPVFILGPQPVLGIVLSPNGNFTGKQGTMKNGTVSINQKDTNKVTTNPPLPVTSPSSLSSGKPFTPTLQKDTNKVTTNPPLPVTSPSSLSSGKPSTPTLQNVLKSTKIQTAISQIPKDVPLPMPNPVDAQLPILPGVNFDYLLPPSLPGSPEDLRLRPLRLLLSMPELTAHLISSINIGAFKTRGELLRAVLMYLIKIKEIQGIQLLLNDLQLYLKRLLGEDGKAPKLQVNWEGLLSALPIPSTTKEAQYFQKIKSFLEPTLSQKLGPGFDPMKYKLKSTLLKQLFKFILSQKLMIQDTELREAIEFYMTRILMHGYGAQPVEYIIVKQTVTSKTVNLSSLFKALDTSKFDSQAKTAYNNMFKFFSTQFDANKHFTGFDFTQFNEKGPWLKNFLEFLSVSEMVPKENRNDFKVLMSYVLMDGEGRKAVEYVN